MRLLLQKLYIVIFGWAVMLLAVFCSTTLILHCSGSCMLPTMPLNTFVIIQRVNVLHEGDIVCADVEIDGEIERIVKRISRIDENGVYLLGDNPPESYDSRYFGYIQYEQIIGKVINFN